jgi:hypothetical protein
MAEKEVVKGSCNEPFKSTYRGLEEGNKEMILPSRSASTLRGPSKKTGKHHHKQKMYDMVSLVYFCYKKMHHMDNTF